MIATLAAQNGDRAISRVSEELDSLHARLVKQREMLTKYLNTVGKGPEAEELKRQLKELEEEDKARALVRGFPVRRGQSCTAAGCQQADW
jgi:hypothetical protein